MLHFHFSKQKSLDGLSVFGKCFLLTNTYACVFYSDFSEHSRISQNGRIFFVVVVADSNNRDTQ